MVIQCATKATAGTVVSLLLNEKLVPAIHFRAEEVDHDSDVIHITIVSHVSEEQLARLHSAIDTVLDCHIHYLCPGAPSFAAKSSFSAS
jgi:hypothetical protein